MCNWPKKDKAKASAAKSGAAATVPAKSPPTAPEAPSAELAKPAPAPKAAEAPNASASAMDSAESTAPQSLPEIKRMAAGMLKTMQDMCRQQQALVSALEKLESAPPAQ